MLRIQGGVSGFVAVVDKFVAEVGGVAIDLEIPLAGLPAVSSVKLPTLVVHHADVAGGLSLAYVTRDWHFNKHTVGAFLVPIDSESQCVFEEAEVEAKVCLRGFLPAKVSVGQYARFCTVDYFFVCARAKDVIVAR